MIVQLMKRPISWVCDGGRHNSDKQKKGPTMKSALWSVAVAATLVSSGAAAEAFQIDTAGSKVEWTGSKVVGGGHVGTLQLKSGEIQYEKNAPKSAAVVVDMKSIKNSDLTDPQWNKKLVDHLHSGDFFDTAKFPEANLKIASFKKVDKENYDLEGTLTIKGITKPIRLKAKTVAEKDQITRIVADLEFDRTDFEVRYGSGKFFENLGDKMISDKVQVKVELKTKIPQIASM